MNSYFVTSLDLELHWGGTEKWPLDQNREYLLNARRVIPKLLQLFADYQIHATWATVGLLFHQDRETLLTHLPSSLPSYHNKRVSPYEYISSAGIGRNEDEDPFHYGASLIQNILATPHQEVGSHTFSHYYCNEPGQTVGQFRDDLKAAQKAARLFGIALRSLVFPRNQLNQEYLSVCWEEGFTVVRSNPKDWFWKIGTHRESKWKRLNRGLDAYFPVGEKTSYSIAELGGLPNTSLCLPASRLLRACSRKEFLLQKLKLMRIIREMKEAAEQGKIYHLWWHPASFANEMDQNLAALERILLAYQTFRERLNMQSKSMKEMEEVVTGA